jgi:phage terminase large subunit-like protein
VSRSSPKKKPEPTQDELRALDEARDAEIKEQVLKAEKVALLEQKFKYKKNLPHLYGFNLYEWQRKYLDSMEHEQFITAANQIGKSSVQIMKCIDWATNKEKWTSLWRTQPRTFWYMYPSHDFATREFYKKWVPDFLPQNEMKDHPVYGWKAEKRGSYIHAIHFNSGVSVYFLSYTQDIMNLQGATVWAMFCDEELPEDFWDEMNFRRQANNGYFSMVFTATMGQKLWFDTMERQGTAEERFQGAFKLQVSLFDCKHFEDGTPSHWTPDAINRVIKFCKNEAEVQRRVYGRFVLDGGLKYSAFDRRRNVCKPHKIPVNWGYYAGVDIGSGGSANHPSTIVIVAVDPTFTEARVVRAWKGDKVLTTDMDVYDKLLELVADAKISLTGIFYDYHAKDFSTIATRRGLAVTPADKRHDVGEKVLNVLFKHGALQIFELEETDALQYELSTLLIETDKRKALDDLCDALRYALTRLPWNWPKIGVMEGTLEEKPPVLEVKREETIDDQRRKRFTEPQSEWTVDAELDAWGELYEVPTQ